MIFENKILPRVPCGDGNITLADCFTFSGLELRQYSDAAKISGGVRSAAAELLKGYTSFSDLLSFISSAIDRSELLLRYALYPPYTTDLSGCRTAFRLLSAAGVAEDVSYSELSRSFLIKLSEKNRLSVTNILSIGICEWLRSALGSSVGGIHTAFNGQIRYPDGSTRRADAVCAGNGRIFILNFEMSVGLEADIPAHDRQFRRLKIKISRSKRFCFGNVGEYFVVSPHTARLLPPLECVVPIDKAESLVEHMCADIGLKNGDE